VTLREHNRQGCSRSGVRRVPAFDFHALAGGTPLHSGRANLA